MVDQSEFRLTPKQDELLDLLGGDAKHILIYGGSRSGKTFLLCFAIAWRAIQAPGSRHAIFRKSGVSVKQSVGLDTFPKVMALAFPGVKYKYHVQDAYFSIYTGSGVSEVWLAGLDDQDRVDKVLGKEFATLYFNEASEISRDSYLTALTRLAQKVPNRVREGEDLSLRCYLDLNPTTKSHWTYRTFVEKVDPESGQPMDPDGYVWAVANPKDNAENLPEDYLESLRNMPERQRRRFWSGEYTGDVEDALWTRDKIKRTWQDIDELNLTRIVVAIDPATSTTPGADETGIIAAGIDQDGLGYVLADESGRHRPEEWARLALALCDEYEADCIVAEKNQGGDMVQSVIEAQQKTSAPRVKLVTATKNKVTRAEPIAALYERGKVRHVGLFDQLEDQMCTFVIGQNWKSQGYSPDRVDALVWAFAELFGKMTRRVRHEPIKYGKLPSIA